MNKTLILFAFSKNVDTYVNVIASIYDKISQSLHSKYNLTRVILVRVYNSTTSLDSGEIEFLFNDILAQIRKISENKYVISFSDYKETDLNYTSGTEIYQAINTLDYQRSSLDYQDLKNEIKKLIKQYGGIKNCIFDLSAGTKIPTFEIYSICIALGIKYIFVFELYDRFNKKEPQKSLYHYVKSEKKYRHINISDNLPITESHKSLIRINQLQIPVFLILLSILIIIALYGNINSLFGQILNIIAIIITIATPILNLIQWIRE